jgi:predicted MFS family arabinose efflux permease
LAWLAEIAGWRNAMLGISAATLFSAAAIMILIRDPPRALSHGSSGFLSGIGEVLRIRALWPLLPLTGISYSVMLAERGLWAGPYFSDVHGLEPVARGNALLVMAIAMSAGAMIYGPLDRMLGTRKWIVAMGAAVTAAAFVALGTLDVSLTGAVLLMGTLGAFGMTYGVLMAHGRSFFPDHLLGRGITLMNILFIGGAGILQPLSGRLMQELHATSPAAAYATLHLAFGLLLLATLFIYLFSQDRKPR